MCSCESLRENCLHLENWVPSSSSTSFMLVGWQIGLVPKKSTSGGFPNFHENISLAHITNPGWILMVCPFSSWWPCTFGAKSSSHIPYPCVMGPSHYYQPCLSARPQEEALTPHLCGVCIPWYMQVGSFAQFIEGLMSKHNTLNTTHSLYSMENCIICCTLFLYSMVYLTMYCTLSSYETVYFPV